MAAARLTEEEIRYFEHRLRERERQLLDELREGAERVQRESFERIAGEAPDSGDASVADTVSHLVNSDRQRDSDELRDVQEALGRLHTGSYGVCLRCGEPIGRERLDASPTARYDVEHQQEIERSAGAGPRTPTL